MDINTIITICGFLITIVGFIITATSIYWQLDKKIALLEQIVSSNKTNTDESINRLIKSLDKLEISIEKLTDKINDEK